MFYVVYIITNKRNGTLYVGITNNLKRRICEHRLGIIKGFSKKYGLFNLIYFEKFKYVKDAIYREKQLKHWNRKYKIDLIDRENSEWNDLYEDVFGPLSLEYQENVLNCHVHNKD